ncbi:GNAT family N-acetyltransferase [Sulfobacillus harzensis]|uniref:GNAT family N-acetyltransferase n=1 Tax=Sulfobacillus harzensis TaxID=2729629 RepID=A0A7Y0Q3H0_9FIRM|nr:GNAT family N-acetyltransferase [Sulfobacillus harzensis]NMP24243.1 GNAT family N-acetyltransferase [Sulfobacillus harzensis]
MIDIRIGKALAIQDVKALWDKIPFARGRNPESIRLAIEETDLCVHAWDGSRLIATARVLTDGAYYATLWDVIVDPEYQGCGIGRAVVHRAVEPFIGRNFSFIALFSAEGKGPFYEQLGFTHHPRGMILQEDRFPEKIPLPNAIKD